MELGSANEHDEKEVKIETTIQINASADQVWQVLTDLRRYPEWNPFTTN